MKVLSAVNLKELLIEYVDLGESNELIEMYYLLDEACGEIENELISRGVWEEDEW
jgi:hypothetical protein